MRRSVLVSVIFFFCVTKIFSQQATNTILPLEDFIAKVKQHHPLATVAAITEEKAVAGIQIAKGAFDPVLDVEANAKTFDGKNYYRYNNGEIKIPLPIGDFKTGIENNEGQFLFSEVTRGSSSYAGVEIPLAKGFIIDKRRAALQQAKIALSENRQQRNMMMNDLLLDAYTSYNEWAGTFKLYNLFSEYVAVSAARLKLVNIGYVNGDRAAMDTTEAFIQMQNFMLLQNEAFMALNTATFQLNNFIWDEKQTAQEIAENVVPDTLVLNAITLQKALLNIIAESNTTNPLLLQYRYKIEGLEVERKLKFQNLLPEVNAKANILNRDFNPLKNAGLPLLENNNRWGVSIKVPLLFRQGRGEYKIAQLKLQENNLLLKQKIVETENKIKDYYNKVTILQTQITTANSALKNYNSLLRNELLRFNNGESSLFLVNTRENKVLEIKQKIIELQVKLLKATYTLNWAAGLLNR
ncbi:MAG: TolC family protein [Ferruginibacter sp.]